ncbi:uncharacterized protein si:rp71-17i16.6 [Alosa sapidissima]|uniref:uncharacterized protein si:rp71-17i16.6 n=1 Tax=Alosa sapidissima TaxID=34773 RepID=UPI001C094752|nr:uncharacterized protein si:rp71-17i16.6 [Alosa sapidissima]
MTMEGEESDNMPSKYPEIAEEEMEPSNVPSYRQYLHRLFGEATTQYFLSDSTLERDTPPWYTQMMDRLGDSLSAEAVWNALSDRTRALVMEIEANSYQAKKVHLEGNGMRGRNYRRHLSGVRLMFRTAKYKEACSAILLERNPPPFFLDLEASGPARYLEHEETRAVETFKD